MKMSGDRSHQPEWKPGSPKIAASARDIARQVQDPPPAATDAAAQVIKERTQNHQKDLADALNALEQGGIKRGRKIQGPTDTALEQSTPIVTATRDRTPFIPEDNAVPGASVVEIMRENASEQHVTRQDPDGVLVQETRRGRRRLPFEGFKDNLTIRDRADGKSEVITFTNGDGHMEGFNPTRPHISTARDQQGNTFATVFAEDGNRMSYHRAPDGTETIS